LLYGLFLPLSLGTDLVDFLVLTLHELWSGDKLICTLILSKPFRATQFLYSRSMTTPPGSTSTGRRRKRPRRRAAPRRTNSSAGGSETAQTSINSNGRSRQGTNTFTNQRHPLSSRRHGPVVRSVASPRILSEMLRAVQAIVLLHPRLSQSHPVSVVCADGAKLSGICRLLRRLVEIARHCWAGHVFAASRKEGGFFRHDF